MTIVIALFYYYINNELFPNHNHQTISLIIDTVPLVTSVFIIFDSKNIN